MYYIYILHTITYAIYMYIYSKYYYKVTITMPYIIYSINFSSDYSIDTLMHIHFCIQTIATTVQKLILTFLNLSLSPSVSPPPKPDHAL